MKSAQKIQARPPRQAPGACPAGVRVATRADAAALYDLVVNGVAKEAASAPVNEFRLKALINDVTQPAVVADIPRAAVMVIDGPDKKPIAAAPIVPRQWWYSSEWHYVQPWIYVREEYRKGPYARTLVETVTWWGTKASLPVIMSLPAADTARAEIYARYAEPFGGSFMHAGGGLPTQRPMNVRVAMPEDYESVISLCLILNGENAQAQLDPDKLHKIVLAGVNHVNGIIAIVSDEAGVPRGCCCLAIDQWDYSNVWHYSEMWVFVHPSYRTKPYALDMINFCKWWSEQSGIPLVMGIMSRDRQAAKVRMYGRYLKPLERFFIHGARHG